METDNILHLPRLQVPLIIWQKMMAYIINCPTEINGFGLVERVNPSFFFLRDVFITEQVAGPAHVENSPEVLGQLLTDMIRRGEDPSMIKFQWHSHVNMHAYFSGTDQDNIDNWTGDWLISLVANKSGQYSCRLDTFKGVRVGVALTPELTTGVNPVLMATTALEIAQKVKRPGGVFRGPRGFTDGKPSQASPVLRIGDPYPGVKTLGG